MAKSKEPIIPREEALQYLLQWGYFGDPNTTTISEILPKIVGKKFNDAIRQYQEFHGLKVDGWLGPKTAHLMDNPLRCGMPDLMNASECAWPMKRVTYFTRLALGIGEELAAQAFDKAAQQWNAVCGLNLVRVSSVQANIVADEGSGRRDQFDGRGGTLAWSYLPCNSRENTRLQQKYDAAERWNFDFLVAVACHELGHAIGLEHLKSGNLLAPYYDPQITKPQAGDIAEVVRRYGEPTIPPNVPDNPPSVPPTGGLPEVDVTVVFGGRTFVAKGQMRETREGITAPQQSGILT